MELEEDVFAAHDFDSYAWIEQALLDKSGDVDSLQTLMPQLTLLSQSVARDLQTTVRQLSTHTAPELQRQLSLLEKSASPLMQQLENVDAQLSEGAATKDVGPSKDLTQLATLHEAKTRMQQCSQMLTEATTWEKHVRICFQMIDRLSSADKDRFIDILSTNDNSASALHFSDRLQQMETSITLLDGMPGADERHRVFQSLHDEVKSIVTTKTEQFMALDPLPTTALAHCQQLLSHVGDTSVLKTAFIQKRSETIHHVWFGYTSDDHGAFVHDYLPTFYEQTLQSLRKEATNAISIFQNPSVVMDILKEVLGQAFHPLSDSFYDRLQSQDGHWMENLLSAWQTSTTFASNLALFFQSVQDGSFIESEQVDGHTTSVSDEVSRGLVKKVLDSVFAPYYVIFQDYEKHVGSTITSEVVAFARHFDSEDESGLDDFAHQMEDIAPALCQVVEKNMTFALDWSHGSVVVPVIFALRSAVSKLTDRLEQQMPSLKSFCHVDENARSNAHPSSLDWSKFHGSLTLLTSCGVLYQQIQELESRLHQENAETIMQWMHVDEQSYRLPSLQDIADESKAPALAAHSMWLVQEPNRLTRLHRFIQEHVDVPLEEQSSYSLLSDMKEALRPWQQAVQRLTFDTVFVPIVQVLDQVPTKDIWQEEPEEEEDMPSSNALPQEYITMVADLLLSLLPQLEPFSESQSLEPAYVASSQLKQEVCTPAWQRLGEMIQLSTTEMNSCQRIFIPPSQDQGMAGEFVDLWTTSLASGTFAALLGAICCIPKLSDQGSRQLAADLNYFHNVLSAVGGGDNFILDELKSTLEMDVEEHDERMQALMGEGSVLYKLQRCLVNKRQESNTVD